MLKIALFIHMQLVLKCRLFDNLKTIFDKNHACRNYQFFGQCIISHNIKLSVNHYSPIVKSKYCKHFMLTTQTKFL